jgi:outer membrane lipoprotein-sorting protein
VGVAVTAALWVFAGAGSVGAQAPATLDELLRRFHEVEGLECRFREEKRIALLSAPIVTEGTLHYARPGRLVRRLSGPSVQVVLVDGSRLRMRDGDRVETIDLASQPVVRSFVDTFGQLLAGDRAGLERSYRIEYAIDEGTRWTLTLRPRASPLDRFVREIRFEGEGLSLRTMVMVEVNGDVTTTTFRDVDGARRYTPEEAARVFTVD